MDRFSNLCRKFTLLSVAEAKKACNVNTEKECMLHVAHIGL